MENANSPEQVRALLTKNNVVEKYLNEFWRLAERNPRTPAALQSLLIVYQIASSLRIPESKSFIEKSSQKITADHLDDPDLFKALFILGQDTSRQTVDLLKQIAAKTSQRPNKGTAYFLNAAILSQKEGRRRRYKQEISSLLNMVQADFSDVSIHDTTLGSLAGNLKFEVEHLSLGSVAPDLLGKDVAGKEVKLSDHQGKVTVIDFFADWCPYCRRMYPDERQFCQEFQSKPFALVGINCDAPARLKKLLESNAVTWPCIADGANGPIASKWRIDSYPTVFVLDAKGVIRYRFSGDPGTQLRAAIEELLAEAEGKTKEKAGVDIDAELAKLKDSMVAESPVTVVGKGIDLLMRNRAGVKPDHVKIVEGWLRTATKQDPKASYLPYFRGSLFLLKDEYPAAIKAYRDLLKRPDVPAQARAGAQNSLAYLLVMRREKKDDLKEAETLIEHAAATLGPLPAIMDTKAMVLLWKGAHDEACEILEDCLDNEVRSSIYFHLAVVEMARGDKTAAKASLEEATTNGFKPEALTKLEKRIHEQLVTKIDGDEGRTSGD
ncbi:MAG: redoxin domain-containing protein [Planctomycetota bacterium]